MGNVLAAWLSAAIGLVAIGLTFVYPPVAVAVGALGTVATMLRLMTLNVPATRLAHVTSIAAQAATLYLCTRSPLLAASLVPVGLANMPWELIMRRARGFFPFQSATALVIGAGLLVTAWPFGWWGLGVLPTFGFGLMMAKMGLTFRAAEPGLTANFKIAVGDRMPDVRLARRDGPGEFILAEERGHHVLLVFVRGDWCPVCHVMMRIIGKESALLQEKQVKVALISPEENAASEELTRQLKIQPGMLIDKDSALVLSLGMTQGEKDGKTVSMALSILIDPQGIVRHISRPDDVSAFATESRMVEILRGARQLAA